jgi:inhibitor of cysteine peptidase
MDPIVLTQSDNGARITLAQGHTLLIRLPENPTTGFRWQAAPGTIVDDAQFVGSSSGAAGAAGEHVFTVTVGSIALTLHFTLARSWERETPAEEFKIYLVPEA